MLTLKWRPDTNPRFVLVAAWLSALTALNGCAASAPSAARTPAKPASAEAAARDVELPQKALIEPDTVRAAAAVTKEINDASDHPANDSKPWFEVLQGDVPIVVTAPHATRAMRDGQYRHSDGGGTAALVRALHELAKVTAIYTNAPSPSDPNYYDDNEFKNELRRQLKDRGAVLVLDMHGSDARRPYEVDLGTMNGASLLGKESLALDLVRLLRAEGIDNLSYNRFPAAQNQTITKFSAGLGVPAIQLEISSTRLSPDCGDLEAHRFAQLLQALLRFIDEQNAAIEPQ